MTNKIIGRSLGTLMVIIWTFLPLIFTGLRSSFGWILLAYLLGGMYLMQLGRAIARKWL